jgi:hypothetical protein
MRAVDDVKADNASRIDCAHLARQLAERKRGDDQVVPAPLLPSVQARQVRHNA